jgi:DNA polymerase I-like protein with 3'-5' exonuclease and polymerase domains
LALDLETKDDGLASNRGAGWVYDSGYICGLAVAWSEGESYFPIRHPDTECFDEDAVRRWYLDHTRSCRVVYHRAVYDLGWAKAQWDAPYPERMEDTIVADFIRNENEFEYNLDAVAKRLGVKGKDEAALRDAASVYGVDAKAGLWRLPARYVGGYASQDARATYDCLTPLTKVMEEENTLEAYRLECDLIPLIVEMRRRGIRINIPYFEQLSVSLKKKRDEALVELGRRLALGRPAEVKELNSNRYLTTWFDREQIPYPRTLGTKKNSEGSPSFESDWMKKRDHWLPQLVVRAKKYEQFASKFLDNYVLGFAHRGRLHSEIHQTKTDDGGTKTTRLAYSDPPLQQAPSRDEELGPAFRKGFQPEDGEVWAAPDYNQQEYRLIVHYANVCRVAGAERPLQIYTENPKADFHNIVVQLTGLVRRDAKDANFAKAYRAGVPKFALMIDKTEAEAREIYERYDDEMPFVSRLAEFCDTRAQQRGYLIMLDGARAHFPKWEPRWMERAARDKAFIEGRMVPCDYETAQKRTHDKTDPWFGCKLRRADTYKAGNKLIQGSAARQTKLAMRGLWREGIIPLIQMHDELSLSTSDERVALRAQAIMVDAVKLVVPTIVDLEYGKTWGDAKVVKDKSGKVLYDASWSAAHG